VRFNEPSLLRSIYHPSHPDLSNRDAYLEAGAKNLAIAETGQEREPSSHRPSAV
jgi:hypothetical protein